MKALLALALAVAFSITPIRAQAPTPAPKPVEYNLAICMPKGIGIIHAVQETKDGKETITFAYSAKDKQTMEADKDPVIFTVTSDVPNKSADGAMDIDAETTLKTVKVDLTGTTYKGRFVATLSTDSDIIATVFGKVGGIDQALAEADDSLDYCQQQVDMDSEAAVDSLDKWLKDGKYPAAQPIPVAPQTKELKYTKQ